MTNTAGKETEEERALREARERTTGGGEPVTDELRARSRAEAESALRRSIREFASAKRAVATAMSDQRNQARSRDLEAYVSGADLGAITSALGEILGPLTLTDEINQYRMYDCGDVSVVIQPGMQDGFVSVWIRGETRWRSDIDLARFLSKRLDCRVRCDPGSDYPGIHPLSDQFLEIRAGKEAIVQLDSDN